MNSDDLDLDNIESKILRLENKTTLNLVKRELFDRAIELLSDLTDLQNGPPLETYREAWEETMQEVYEFLNKYETK